MNKHKEMEFSSSKLSIQYKNIYNIFWYRHFYKQLKTMYDQV